MSEADYGLVMPFICCASNGGPYDDNSFVAGMRCQDVWSTLMQTPLEFSTCVETELVAQMDLIAMNFGYQMTSEPWADAPEEWTLVAFVRGIRP